LKRLDKENNGSSSPGLRAEEREAMFLGREDVSYNIIW
jgi:hypothetical protein